MKGRFAARFLTSFAVLMVGWWGVRFAAFYRAAVLATTQLLSPLVSGWVLEYAAGQGGDVVFRLGAQELPMLLQLPALSLGFVPFVSLLVATPGQGVRRTFVNAVVGGVLYFLVHVAVVSVYPLIMNEPNVLKDTLGVFTGLLAFVVAPLGLWFVLTYPTLRSWWQLSPEQGKG